MASAAKPVRMVSASLKLRWILTAHQEEIYRAGSEEAAVNSMNSGADGQRLLEVAVDLDCSGKVQQRCRWVRRQENNNSADGRGLL
jgi:hypothetical protein